MTGFSFEFIPKAINAPESIAQFKPYIGTEDQLQMVVASYLDFSNAFWTHPPNGGKRNIIVATKLKKMGVKPGIPDVLIFDQKNGYSGFAIELKVGKNKPSLYQIQCLKALHDRNWLILVSNSLDEVIYWIDWYFNEKKLAK